MNSVTDSLSPGDVIQDTYRIDSVLGEGGMGATFAGTNLASGHRVAIKVITAAFARNARATDLFRREANLLRTIQHDAVVRYETTIQDARKRLYLVMELLEGHSLAWFIEQGARLSPRDTLLLGRRLAAGLDAVAAVGAVHRDIAPDNIFVPGDDIQASKLIDFGLASQTVGTEKSIIGSDFAGKYSYSAPEQLGVHEAAVSVKTDAYALGLVLMKVCGLPVPGEGKQMAAAAHRKADIEIPADRVGPALQGVLQHLLRFDPDDRPSPITPVFEAALQEIDAETPKRSERTEAAIAGATRRSAGIKPSKPLIIGGIALVAVAAAAAGWVALDPLSPAPTGLSTGQAQIAGDIVDEDDPVATARREIASGDRAKLDPALGAMVALGRDDARAAPMRIDALILAAEMADPATFDAARSPFPAPNPILARQLYREAAALGSDAARTAAARLEE